MKITQSARQQLILIFKG